MLDDKSGLTNWKAAVVGLGVARNKSLLARFAAINANGGGYQGNKKPLRTLVDQAAAQGGGSNAADDGTAFHEFADLDDQGILDWDLVPEDFKGPLDAYATEKQRLGIEYVDSEVFVAIDHKLRDSPGTLRAAGSLDRLWRVPGLDGVLVGDVKTGANEPKFGGGVTIQTFLYSLGLRYRDDRFDGSPAFTDGAPALANPSFRKELDPDLNTQLGLMAHCPLKPSASGRFRCRFYVLDFGYAEEAVELGQKVLAARVHPKLEAL